MESEKRRDTGCDGKGEQRRGFGCAKRRHTCYFLFLVEPNSGIVTRITPSPSVGLSSYELRGLQVHAVYKYMVAFVSCLVCA